MKKLLVHAGLLLLALAGCAPRTPTALPTTGVTSSPVEATPTRSPVDLTSAQRAAIASLSGTLGLPADQIKLISTQAVTWPNGCIGVQRIGVMCTAQQVPGFVVVLEANRKQYEFHTNHDGSAVVPANGVQASGPAQDAVRDRLASMLGIDAKQITIVSDAEVEWPDSCLGVAQEGIMCAMIVTPGHLITLEANDIQYEYHTNADGSAIQPATLVLTWKRKGGIAGFCDSLTVYLSGEVNGFSCKPGADVRNGSLLSSERAQLENWVMQFGQSNLDASDPVGVSDRMTRTLSLFGKGSGQPSSADQEVLFSWAQNLFQRLYK